MKKLILSVVVMLFAVSSAFSTVTIQLWHGYRGEERDAIEQVARSFNIAHRNIQVRLLAIPFDALNDRLRATIPLGTGPDVFIFAQDFVGSWAENNIILPIESFVDKETLDQYFGNTLRAFQYMYPGAQWALPGAFKNVALYYNENLVRQPPLRMSEIIEVSKRFTNPSHGAMGRYGFVYETGNFYYHTMWVQGFGGTIFRRIGTGRDGFPVFLPLLYSEPMIKAGEYVKKNILDSGIVPIGPSGTLVTQLFNTGNAMFVINGQWFRGEIDSRISYGLSEPPVIDEINRRAIPFLTVEGYFLSACARNQRAAIEVIKYFTSAAMGRVFAEVGKQTPANRGSYEYDVVKRDKIAQIFREAAGRSWSMPNSPEMALTWDPATSGLNDILGGRDPAEAWKERQIQLMKSIEENKKAPGMFRNLGYDYNRMTEPLSVSGN
jgi:arabinogalactan oligomer/maltooligosaccharide transport system substrate-binding protein